MERNDEIFGAAVEVEEFEWETEASFDPWAGIEDEDVESPFE